MPVKIGNITLSHGVLLAPMAGVTDAAFRRICRGFGAEYTVSEMISAKALWFHDKKTEVLAALSAAEQPAAIQIFGHEPEIMAFAAQTLETMAQQTECRPAAIDINMGCPVPKIVNNGDGSALMRDLPLAAKIMEAVRRATSLPVSVKFRTGFTSNENCCAELAHIAVSCGMDMICIHGRTRRQMYAPPVDLDSIARVCQTVGHAIPVIGNGDVESAQDAQEMLRQTGCYAVMVGRGAMGNPWIFRDWQRARQGLPPAAPSPRERIETAHAHARALVAHKGEYIGLREMRKHAAWYLKGLRGSAQVRVRVNLAQNFEELSDILQAYLADLEREEAPAAPHSPE